VAVLINEEVYESLYFKHLQKNQQQDCLLLFP